MPSGEEIGVEAECTITAVESIGDLLGGCILFAWVIDEFEDVFRSGRFGTVAGPGGGYCDGKRV
jgi:hypothetical protein